jgi:acetolactate synthase-1/2/3 large subunit
MTETKTVNGGRLLVDCLIVQGCDRIFAVPGESFLAVLDALHDSPEVQTVICRQEGGAAFMACADGAMTGKPGVCFVTRGPGATNASIGAHVAFQDSQPMLLFIGDVDRSMRDREGFQEVDFGLMFAPLAKAVLRIDDPRRIPEYVARAWQTAISGRPGPVVVVLPEDMLLEGVSGAAPRPPVYRPAQAVCPDAMTAMMRLICDAAAPVAIVGGAGWHAKAREHFTAFAERIGLPVAGAFRRQDAMPNSSRVWAGNLGYGPNPRLVQRIREADLILAVGARLGEATTDGYTLVTPDHPDQVLIHVHPDPDELGRVYRADLAICADVGEFAEEAALWDDGVIPFDAGEEAHLQWLDWTTAKPGPYPLDMASCVSAMRESFPGDTIICNGAGNFSGWWHRYWHYNGFPTQLAPTAGAMGYGVPAAVAAALRHPDRQVVALAGDGDFLMNGQELATAVQYGCDLLVILIDNGTYGTIRMHQEREFPARVSGTSLVNPDFAMLAKAYGGWSERVETTAQFISALEQARERKGLRLIHALIDPEQLSAGGATISGLRAKAGK